MQTYPVIQAGRGQPSPGLCVGNGDLLAWWQVRSTSLLYHLGRTCLMQSYSCCFGPVVSAKTQTVKAINQGCMFVNKGLSFERFESLTLTHFCFSNFQKSSAGVSERSPRVLQWFLGEGISVGPLKKHLEEFCFQRLGLFKMENTYDLSCRLPLHSGIFLLLNGH